MRWWSPFLSTVVAISGFAIAPCAQTITVTALGEIPRIRPGEAVTLAYGITNHAEEGIVVPLVWSIPVGWEALGASTEIRVAPQTKEVILVHLQTTGDSPQGVSRVELSALGAHTATALVFVERFVDVHIRLLKAPLRVGETPDEIRWRIENTGNDSLEAVLVLNGRWLDVSPIPETVRLGPNQSLDISSDLVIGGDLGKSAMGLVRLEAFVAGESFPRASVRSRIRVIPPASFRGQPPEAKALVRAYGVGGALGHGGQLSLNVDVPIRSDSQVRAYLRSLTKSNFLSRYTRQGGVVFGLEAPKVSMRGGTDVFAFSPLAGSYRFGTGASAEVEWRGTRFVGAVRRQREQRIESTVGVKGDVAGLEGRANVYTRPGARALSVGVQSYGRGWGALDTEVGASFIGRVVPAYRFTWGGRIGRTTLAMGASEVPQQYVSTAQGQRSRTMSFGHQLSRRTGLRIRAQSREYGRVRETDSGGEVLRREAVASLSHRMRLRGGTFGGRSEVSIRDYKSGGRDAVGTFGVASASLRTGEVILAANARVGTISEPSGRNRPSGSASASLGWRRDRNRITGTVHGTSGSVLERAGESFDWGGRIRADLNVQAVSLTADYAWSIRRGLVAAPIRAGARSEIRIGIRVPTQRGPVLIGDLISASQNGEGQPVQFRVGVELDISAPSPLRLRPDVVSGFVIDHTTGVGIPDVLVSLGDDMALTGPLGRFEFMRPQPGEYVLQVDRISLGAGSVPTVATPLRVSVLEGVDTQDIMIPVAQRSRIVGTVRALEVRGGLGNVAADTVDTGSVSRAVVVARSADDMRRVQANREGEFALEDLPPGDWVVTATKSGSVGDDQVITVMPGLTSNVELRIVKPPVRVRLVAPPVRRVVAL